MKEKNYLDLSWGSIFRLGFFLFLVYLIYQIREILILTLFSIILAILFENPISFLQKKKIPRSISVLIVYFSFFTFLGLLTFLVSAPVFNEIQKFSSSIPQYFEKISPYFQKLGIEIQKNFEEFILNVQQGLIQASKTILSALFAIFGGFFSTLTIFSLSLFLSLEERGIEKLIEFFSPSSKKEKILEFFKRSQERVSKWFGVRILGCFLVGFLVFISLLVFKINYAFSLSVFAGFLNLIPILGPLFSGAVIVILASLDSLTKGLFLLLSFILIQLIEGNLFTPILTQKIMGFSPFLVLLSLLIGGKLFGIWGAILGIPLVAMIFDLIKEVLTQEL